MSWSPQQSKAIEAVKEWLATPKSPQVFRLFGYAGTGKTTIAKEIAGNVNGKVLYGAFTGKAALVLRSKGCINASTIHSMIYRIDDTVEGKPKFVKNDESDIRSASLIIIDECSMVDEQLGQDLLSFGVRVLVLGDPGQLPPVKGQGFFTSATPDIILTEIHRQAADNPIIRLSMEVRSGKRLTPGSYGDSKIITRRDVQRNEVLLADKVLVGLNRTRRSFNMRIRELNGTSDPLPVEGDTLICLKNNREKGFMNGSIWTIEDVDNQDGLIEANIIPGDDYTTGGAVEIKVPEEFFFGTEDTLHWAVRSTLDEFDYGYAITVHKSQGSQFDDVMLFDESAPFRGTKMNWLYTGITRAAERITIVI